MMALAVLDGRIRATEEDWDLSGVVMAVSDWQRELLVRELAAERERVAVERGHEQGVSRVASEDTAYDHRVRQVADWIRRTLPKVQQAASDGAARIYDLKRRQRSDRRDFIEPALRRLIEAGEYTVDTETGVITQQGSNH